jgi:hypothetical protein
MFRRSWRPTKLTRRRVDPGFPQATGSPETFRPDVLPCACGTRLCGSWRVASAGTTPGSALKCRPAEAPLSTWTGVSSWPRSTSSWIPIKPRYPAVVDLACRARRGHVGSSDLTHPAALLRSFSRPKGSAGRSWPAIMPHRTKNRRDPTNPARGSQRPTGKATARRNQSGADPILLGEFAMPRTNVAHHAAGPRSTQDAPRWMA